MGVIGDQNSNFRNRNKSVDINAASSSYRVESPKFAEVHKSVIKENDEEDTRTQQTIIIDPPKRLKGSELLMLAQPHLTVDQRANEYQVGANNDSKIVMMDEDDDLPYQMIDDSILNIELNSIQQSSNIRRGSRLLKVGPRKNVGSQNFNPGLRSQKSPPNYQSQDVKSGPNEVTDEQEGDFNEYNDNLHGTKETPFKKNVEENTEAYNYKNVGPKHVQKNSITLDEYTQSQQIKGGNFKLNIQNTEQETA